MTITQAIIANLIALAMGTTAGLIIRHYQKD